MEKLIFYLILKNLNLYTRKNTVKYVEQQNCFNSLIIIETTAVLTIISNKLNDCLTIYQNQVQVELVDV